MSASTNEVSDSHCPLCEGSSFSRIQCGLLRCDACSQVISPLIWQPRANLQMEDAWFGESFSLNPSSFWRRKFEVWKNRGTLSRLKILPLKGKRLLEVGVGNGGFLQAAKDQGFDVMGVDLSAPICMRVERENGIPMHCGTLESLQMPQGFDVVIMNHVLEHVERPIEFLQDAFRLLVPDGFIHLAVPNVTCWEANLSGWTSYEPYHLSYFERRTLERAIKLAGFSEYLISSKESFSGWFLTTLRTALRVNRDHRVITMPVSISAVGTPRSRSGLVEHAYRLAMVIVGGGLSPLRWFQGSLGYGDELICIAHKPLRLPGE